mgnify:CR=1 FL=1
MTTDTLRREIIEVRKAAIRLRAARVRLTCPEAEVLDALADRLERDVPHSTAVDRTTPVEAGKEKP